LARDVPELKPYLADVSTEVNEGIKIKKTVLLEGTQGIFLSLFHGTYPYVTGRDTSASAVCSEVGVGPTSVDDVLLVLKSFMTRVGAGPLPGEISKEEAIKRGWFETASGTGRDRRAAPFSFELAKRSVMINGATQIALTKLDAIFPEVKSARTFEEFPEEAKQFVVKVEKETGIRVNLIGTGPDAFDVTDRRK
jgi:adenylosuccinate synthase